MKVTVALAGSPQGWDLGLQHPDDFTLPWAERERIELDVGEPDRIATTLLRAAEHFAVNPPSWAGGALEETHLAFVDFYRPEARSLTLRREFPLLDDHERVFFPRSWREITHGELERAAAAGVLPGDSRRLYLLVQPGIGNGMLADLFTQVELWEQWWDVFRFVWDEIADEALRGFGLWQIWRWVKDKNLDEAPRIIEGRLADWRQRGLRPDNLRDFIGQGPWESEQMATLLGCTIPEAEALLLGYGCARGQDGLWRKGVSPEAQFLQDTIELLVGLPSVDREAFRRLAEDRFRQFQAQHQPPALDWSELHQLPQDVEAIEAQLERQRRWYEDDDVH